MKIKLTTLYILLIISGTFSCLDSEEKKERLAEDLHGDWKITEVRLLEEAPFEVPQKGFISFYPPDPAESGNLNAKSGTGFYQLGEEDTVIIKYNVGVPPMGSSKGEFTIYHLENHDSVFYDISGGSIIEFKKDYFTYEGDIIIKPSDTIEGYDSTHVFQYATQYRFERIK
jgi:hypothetical protein